MRAASTALTLPSKSAASGAPNAIRALTLR